MNNIIRQVSEADLEAIAIEAFINEAQVTKVSPHSVNLGLIRGNVRGIKLAMKDLALAVARLFPDLASDDQLDDVADDHGIAPRLGAAQSSVFVRLVGSPGTTYLQGTQTVSDSKGNTFDLEADLTIGTAGYGYVKVRSQQAGAFTNVDPYTITTVSPVPSGHVGCLNEYGATGGRDAEDRDTFLKRIKEGPDELAQDTLSYLTQVFVKINPNVLRVIYEGTSVAGKVVLSILTVNGIDLTSDELNTLLQQGGRYLALTELAPIGTQSYGVQLKNVTYGYIDVSMRLGLFTGASYTQVIKDIQQKYAKYVDFRYWDSSVDVVDYVTLIEIARGVAGVKSVPDNYFSPAVDQLFRPNVFPRFRSFKVYDLSGTLQVDETGVITPVLYPNQVQDSFVQSVL